MRIVAAIHIVEDRKILTLGIDQDFDSHSDQADSGQYVSLSDEALFKGLPTYVGMYLGRSHF